MKGMLLEFFQTDIKLILAWASSAIIVLLNKFEVSFFKKHEIWRDVTLDTLTVILLVITIIYTIKKWKRLNRTYKQGKEK